MIKPPQNDIPGRIDRREKLFSAKRFDVIEIEHHDDAGNVHTRQIAKHPGSCAILPIVDENHVCLIWNFRVAVERWMLEIPAGTLEPGEEPLKNAARELKEETGYSATRIEPIHTLAMSPGILNEPMHLFLATGLISGTHQRETGEMIENEIIDLDTVDLMLGKGQIDDAKTAAALLWYLRYGRRGTYN